MINVKISYDAAQEITTHFLFDILNPNELKYNVEDPQELVKAYEVVLRYITSHTDERLKIFDTIYDKIIDKDV